MRIIDVYREDSNSVTGFRLIGTDYIQTGEILVSRSSNAKVFTMSDGSLMMYPVEKDKIQTTLQLECGRSQAALLENAMHYGKLLFAGMSAGTALTATPTGKNYAGARKNALAGYLTGNFRTKQVSSGMFAMEIVLQLENTGSAGYLIPVIMTGFGTQEGLKIQESIQNFSDFIYRKDGIFHRKQVIFTSDAQISIAFPVILSIDAGNISGKIMHNSIVCQSWSSLAQGDYCETVQQLQKGMNLFEITLFTNEYTCKPLNLQFHVYKFP